MAGAGRSGKSGRAMGSTVAAAASGGLDAIARAAAAATAPSDATGDPKQIQPRGPAPVHLWNPPYCGALDIRIAADGTWFYLGTPIGRPALVRLFASVLRKDEDGRTYLVTPVEKIGITVDDAPFIAVDVEETSDDSGAPTLTFETALGDKTVLGPDRPLRVETDPESGEPRPYVLVRGRLEALIDRKTFLRLAELGEMRRDPDGAPVFGVTSQGAFFPLAHGAALEAAAAGEGP